MASTSVEFTCFVHGLDLDTDEKALKKAFSKFGNVTDSNIVRDRVTGRSKRFGFVTFEEEKSMRDAIKGMNGDALDGRSITVKVARPRKPSASEEFARVFVELIKEKERAAGL